MQGEGTQPRNIRLPLPKEAPDAPSPSHRTALIQNSVTGGAEPNGQGWGRGGGSAGWRLQARVEKGPLLGKLLGNPLSKPGTKGPEWRIPLLGLVWKSH